MKCGVIKMKSKEALEKLRRLAVNSESDLSNSSIAKEYTAIIEKDLEVLKIIKKAPFVLESILDNNIRFKNRIEFVYNYMFGTITKSEIELVKNFLEEGE